MSESQSRQLEFVDWQELEYAGVRDIRPRTVDRIKERIEEDGYDPSNAMRVVDDGEKLVVADGNHRLQALEELSKNGGVDTSEVPCLVESDVDLVAVTVESNKNESTYAEQDLFDYLDYIDRLREDHTQAEIGDKLGWSRSKVQDHVRVLKIDAEVLEMARKHQEGRASGDDANASFNFTEGWFRNSGIYELNNDRQEQFIKWFCFKQNCDVAKSKVESEIESLQQIQQQREYIRENLIESVSDEDRESLIEEVEDHAYTNEQLQDAVESLNRGAKSQYYFDADALEELQKLEDNKIDVVVTDPPWGVEFESRRKTDNPDYDTDKEETLAYLDKVFDELTRVCKANAHLYVFFPIEHYCEFQEIAGNYFDVNDVPLMWVKNNHAPVGDERGYEKKYARQYEPIYVCRMENGYSRTLNKDVSQNVLNYARPTGQERWHDSQKPVALLEDIITNVTGKHETVLDPFMGSGSTILAAAKNDRHYIGVEKNDKYKREFEKRLREVE